VSLIDDAKNAATMRVPGSIPDAHRQLFDAMAPDELATTWRALQSVSLREQTEGTCAAAQYFDSLSHDDPGRAFELVLNVLRSETETSILLQLGTRLMCTLVHRHGALLIDRMEAEARDDARVRWLIGGIAWWASDKSVKSRLMRIADVDAWTAAYDAHETPAQPIDYASLSLSELAPAWVEQTSKAEKDRDQNWHDLADYERELRDDHPDKAVDLILEILKIETNSLVLAVLAAGLLEDVIGAQSIDRIEREAASNERFRELLRGVGYHGESRTIKARLDAIARRVR
jgi:hypothetical protein